jgi:DNA-binding response OmpR family regulator
MLADGVVLGAPATDREREELTVTVVTTSANALTELRHAAFDLVILDVNVSDPSRLDVLRMVRALGPSTHVIVLSTAGQESDRLRAFELGADDYIIKPFFPRELTARVFAACRQRRLTADTGLQHGPIAIDLDARQVTVDDAPVGLTAKEFDLLAFLAARPRQTFSRDELLRSIWQSGTDWQQASTVTEHVRRLRTKIEQDPHHPCLLQTVRGVGYRFDPPV